MAKMTLLEMVQDILNDTDSDPVSAISDTEEAIQCSQILKTSYYEMMASQEWPHLNTVTQLIASVATNKALLKLPDLISSVMMISYNKARISDTKAKYEEVEYLDPVKFICMLNSRDSSSTKVDVVIGYDQTRFNIHNDRPPRYWTSFDDENILFDAYDSAVETELDILKTQVVAQKSAVWSDHDDGFIPALPEKAFPAFLAEAKSTAFTVLQQDNNDKAEQKASRTSARLSRKSSRLRRAPARPNYGRR